jgi:hypothetical protein
VSTVDWQDPVTSRARQREQAEMQRDVLPRGLRAGELRPDRGQGRPPASHGLRLPPRQGCSAVDDLHGPGRGDCVQAAQLGLAGGQGQPRHRRIARWHVLIPEVAQDLPRRVPVPDPGLVADQLAVGVTDIKGQVIAEQLVTPGSQRDSGSFPAQPRLVAELSLSLTPRSSGEAAQIVPALRGRHCSRLARAGHSGRRSAVCLA